MDQAVGLPLAGGQEAEGHEHRHPSGKAVAQPEALNRHAEGKSQQVRKADPEHYTVQQRNDQVQLGVSGTVDQREPEGPGRGSYKVYNYREDQHVRDRKHSVIRSKHAENCGREHNNDQAQHAADADHYRGNDAKYLRHPLVLAGAKALPYVSASSSYKRHGNDACKHASLIVDTSQRRISIAAVVDPSSKHGLGQGYRSALDGHWNSKLYQRLCDLRIYPEAAEFKVETEFVALVVEVDERRYEAYSLADNCCQRSSERAHVHVLYEGHVQDDVEDRRYHYENERPLGITHSTEYAADHIVPSDKEDAEDAGHVVIVGLGERYFVCVQPVQRGIAHQHTEYEYHSCRRERDHEHGCDHLNYAVVLFGADILRDDDLPCTCKSYQNECHQVKELASYGDSGHTYAAFYLPDDDHVYYVVDCLQEVSQEKRRRVSKQLLYDTALREVFYHCFVFCHEFFLLQVP